MKTTLAIVTATSVFALTTAAWAADQWDMPMAYSASNFHSANGAEFARCVTLGTGGELEIVTGHVRDGVARGIQRDRLDQDQANLDLFGEVGGVERPGVFTAQMRIFLDQ